MHHVHVKTLPSYYFRVYLWCVNCAWWRPKMWTYAETSFPLMIWADMVGFPGLSLLQSTKLTTLKLFSQVHHTVPPAYNFSTQFTLRSETQPLLRLPACAHRALKAFVNTARCWRQARRRHFLHQSYSPRFFSVFWRKETTCQEDYRTNFIISFPSFDHIKLYYELIRNK